MSVQQVSTRPHLIRMLTLHQSMATTIWSERRDLLRRLCLPNGWSRRQHQPHLLRCPIRSLYYFHQLVFFVDKTGRRFLLIYGAIGMGVCQFVVGGLMGTYGKIIPGGVGNPPNANVIIEVEGAPAHTIIAFFYLLIIIYALTLAPVAWVYAAEVWSLETRAPGMALASVANWLFNFALGLFVPLALRNITYKILIILASFVLALRFKPSSLIQKPVARLWRKLRSCLARVAQCLGTLSRVIQD